MAKKKKGPQAPKLVAPEPPGDEWEVDLQWDRVSNRGVGPAFFNGAHTAATENVFGVRYDVASAVQGRLQDERPGLAGERATDAYVKAEVELREAHKGAIEATTMLGDLENLHLTETHDSGVDKEKFSKELHAVLMELGAAEHELDAEMEKTVSSFYAEQKNILNRLFELVARDSEIEDAFNERVAAMERCERVTNAYHAEHRQHVETMEQMQMHTITLQQTALDTMTATLQKTAQQLTMSAAYQGTKAPVDDNRAQLITELRRLQKQSGSSLRRRGDVAQGSADLQRLVELEAQRLDLARTRNATLRQQVRLLSEGAAREGATQATPEGLSGSRPAQPQHQLTNGEDVSNELMMVRRQLDSTVRELAAAQERLHNLRRYHLVQLSGNYKPISLSSDALRTTHNFLDPDTNAAVRAAVIESVLEVNNSLKLLEQPVSDGGALPEQDPLPHLSHVTTLSERKAVQNYVVKKINRLFTCMYPTAPALSLLRGGDAL